MAKGNNKNRKRANGKSAVDVQAVQKQDVMQPLTTVEAKYFEELKMTSNQYAEALSKRDQYRVIIKQLKDSRKKIQDGDIKLPVDITLIPNVMTYPEDNKKEVLKIFDKTAQNYIKALQALESKVTYLGEVFKESGIRNKEYFDRRFGGLKAASITPGRVAIKDEKTLFEAEIDELIDPKKKEEFKKAKKEAVKHNKELVKKQVSR